MLAAPWLANAVGINASSAHDEIDLGIGGRELRVGFVDLNLRLHPDGGSDDEYIEWSCEVGLVSQWKPTFQMILGQRGFFDRFTVTMNRQAQTVAIEEWDAFDGRFGVQYLD